MPRHRTPLTPKQQRFFQEYLVDLNATAAALRAGYAKRSARTTSQKLLVDRRIVEAIAKAQQRREIRTEITQDRVLRELAAIAFSDPRKLFDSDGILKTPDQWDEETAAAMAAIDNEEIFEGRGEGREQIGTLAKVKRWDKPKALELLMRHLGMFPPSGVRVNVPGEGDGEGFTVELVQFGAVQDPR